MFYAEYLRQVQLCRCETAKLVQTTFELTLEHNFVDNFQSYIGMCDLGKKSGFDYKMLNIFCNRQIVEMISAYNV